MSELNEVARSEGALDHEEDNIQISLHQLERNTLKNNKNPKLKPKVKTKFQIKNKQKQINKSHQPNVYSDQESDQQAQPTHHLPQTTHPLNQISQPCPCSCSASLLSLLTPLITANKDHLSASLLQSQNKLTDLIEKSSSSQQDCGKKISDLGKRMDEFERSQSNRLTESLNILKKLAGELKGGESRRGGAGMRREANTENEKVKFKKKEVYEVKEKEKEKERERENERQMICSILQKIQNMETREVQREKERENVQEAFKERSNKLTELFISSFDQKLTTISTTLLTTIDTTLQNQIHLINNQLDHKFQHAFNNVLIPAFQNSCNVSYSNIKVFFYIFSLGNDEGCQCLY